MKPADSTAPSQRQLRVGELIRHALAEILARGEIADPDIDGVIITVPEVRMSPDLKHALCLVMPLGGKNTDKVICRRAAFPSRQPLRGRRPGDRIAEGTRHRQGSGRGELIPAAFSSMRPLSLSLSHKGRGNARTKLGALSPSPLV